MSDVMTLSIAYCPRLGPLEMLQQKDIEQCREILGMVLLETNA